MRLLAGVLAGLPIHSELVGDESLSRRPMDRIAEPLRAMGALVTGRGDRYLHRWASRAGRCGASIGRHRCRAPR